MRIRLVTKKYVPAAGGAERSIHELLSMASQLGHQVDAVVEAHPKYGRAAGPVRLHQVRGEREIEEALVRDPLPDMVFTQIDWNRTAVRVARKQRIPVVHFSRVGDLNPEADFQVFNSRFVREKWLRTHPHIESRSIVLHPTIGGGSLGPPRRGGPSVLAINPVRAKGGQFLLEIARRMPATRFLATRGWCDPLADGVDLRSLPNIKLLAPRDGIGDFCAASFALVMPVLWDEPFGRVVVEAMAVGLPVVAVRRGGLQEAMGGAGILLEPEDCVDAWVSALAALQQRGAAYARERERGLLRAARYPAECNPGRLLKRMSTLRREYRGPASITGPPAPHVNGEWFANIEGDR